MLQRSDDPVWWGPGWWWGGGWRASQETPPWRVCSSFRPVPFRPLSLCLGLWHQPPNRSLSPGTLPSFHSHALALLALKTVAKGATEGCRMGEWQNLSYISTDRSHISSLCLRSSSSVWPHAPMWQDPFLAVLCSGHTGYTVTFQATFPQPGSLASEQPPSHLSKCTRPSEIVFSSYRGFQDFLSGSSPTLLPLQGRCCWGSGIREVLPSCFSCSKLFDLAIWEHLCFHASFRMNLSYWNHWFLFFFPSVLCQVQHLSFRVIGMRASR